MKMWTKLHIIVLVCLGLSEVNSSYSRDPRLYRILPTAALSLAEWPSYRIADPNGPGTYAFGYEIEDAATGNVQFKDEEKLFNGTVIGSYGYLRPDGVVTITKYTADTNGYRTHTETYKNPGILPMKTTTTSRPIRVPLTSLRPPFDFELKPPIQVPADIAQQIWNQHKIELYPTSNPAADNSIMNADVANLVHGIGNAVQAPNKNKHNLSLQFVNNFVPASFPIIPFEKPKRKETAANTAAPVMHDPVNFETATFANDRFRDPIVQYPHSVHRISENALPVAETKEALWYKDLIKRRRQQFLEKYQPEALQPTIPPEYTHTDGWV